MNILVLKKLLFIHPFNFFNKLHTTKLIAEIREFYSCEVIKVVKIEDGAKLQNYTPLILILCNHKGINGVIKFN